MHIVCTWYEYEYNDEWVEEKQRANFLLICLSRVMAVCVKCEQKFPIHLL